MLGEITHLQGIIDDLVVLTAEPHKLPAASEQVRPALGLGDRGGNGLSLVGDNRGRKGQRTRHVPTTVGHPREPAQVRGGVARAHRGLGSRAPGQKSQLHAAWLCIGCQAPSEQARPGDTCPLTVPRAATSLRPRRAYRYKLRCPPHTPRAPTALQSVLPDSAAALIPPALPVCPHYAKHCPGRLMEAPQRRSETGTVAAFHRRKLRLGEVQELT